MAVHWHLLLTRRRIFAFLNGFNIIGLPPFLHASAACCCLFIALENGKRTKQRSAPYLISNAKVLPRIKEISPFPAFSLTPLNFVLYILIIDWTRDAGMNVEYKNWWEFLLDLFPAFRHHRLKRISMVQRCLVLNSNLATITVASSHQTYHLARNIR